MLIHTPDVTIYLAHTDDHIIPLTHIDDVTIYLINTDDLIIPLVHTNEVNTASMNDVEYVNTSRETTSPIIETRHVTSTHHQLQTDAGIQTERCRSSRGV